MSPARRPPTFRGVAPLLSNDSTPENALAHPGAAAVPLATELWASLHGIVDLRITKPEMPWPEPAALIDPALAAVLAATRPEPDD